MGKKEGILFGVGTKCGIYERGLCAYRMGQEDCLKMVIMLERRDLVLFSD